MTDQLRRCTARLSLTCAKISAQPSDRCENPRGCAGRWRLIRALVVEGVLLSVAGAALGVALAYGGVQFLIAWLPPNLPRVADIGLDLRVLVAAAGAAILTGVFFGIVPAFQSSRPDLTSALNDSGRANTAGKGSQRLRSALVVAEVALAVVLLVGAGLFIGSFIRLMNVDTGLDYRNVLALSVGVRVQGSDFEEP
jgi:putative ABC transport system permease protein